jgi:hypothetical protein
MDRPYQNLSRNKLTRLALMSQDAGCVAAAIKELGNRGTIPAQIIEFAGAHLQTLLARDQALHDLRYFKEIFPKLEQRVRDLESYRASPAVN